MLPKARRRIGAKEEDEIRMEWMETKALHGEGFMLYAWLLIGSNGPLSLSLSDTCLCAGKNRSFPARMRKNAVTLCLSV